MAQGIGSVKQILGQVDTFGGHFWSPVNYSGPASYVQGGDTLDPKVFGFNNSIFTLTGSVDGTDTYQAVPMLYSGGVNPVWRIVWIALTSAGGQTPGEEVTAGTNLSGVTVGLSAIGY
jgi:hypothetical protein